jgi:hypothetical protein
VAQPAALESGLSRSRANPPLRETGGCGRPRGLWRSFVTTCQGLSLDAALGDVSAARRIALEQRDGLDMRRVREHVHGPRPP